MERALEDAGLKTGQIDYINAAAAGVPDDALEAKAIAQLFGESPFVSATKSMTGHECWMAGASEVIYTSLMARDSFLAPNINFENLPDDCPDINVIPDFHQ